MVLGGQDRPVPGELQILSDKTSVRGVVTAAMMNVGENRIANGPSDDQCSRNVHGIAPRLTGINRLTNGIKFGGGGLRLDPSTLSSQLSPNRKPRISLGSWARAATSWEEVTSSKTVHGGESASVQGFGSAFAIDMAFSGFETYLGSAQIENAERVMLDVDALYRTLKSQNLLFFSHLPILVFAETCEQWSVDTETGHALMLLHKVINKIARL
jgi:hypothetical protein